MLYSRWTRGGLCGCICRPCGDAARDAGSSARCLQRQHSQSTEPGRTAWRRRAGEEDNLIWYHIFEKYCCVAHWVCVERRCVWLYFHWPAWHGVPVVGDVEELGEVVSPADQRKLDTEVVKQQHLETSPLFLPGFRPVLQTHTHTQSHTQRKGLSRGMTA